jgi:hypothetical protein
MNIFRFAEINIISIGLLLTSAISSPVFASSTIGQNTMKENFVRSSILVASAVTLEEYEEITFNSCQSMQTYFNSLYAKTNEKIKFHDFANSKLIAGFLTQPEALSIDQKSYYCSGYYTKTTPLGTKVCQTFIAAEPRGKSSRPARNQNVAKNDYDPPDMRAYPRLYIFRYGLGFSFQQEFYAKEYQECRWRE